LIVLLFPGLLVARSGIALSGAEHSITRPLPGFQDNPALAIGPSGGFLVWDDNVTDPSGMGISAIALDANLSASGLPFRVNHTGIFDQERPQVALFNGGGAVFVWQSGRQGFQHIYARFLSASNTWLGAELLISTSPKESQVHPAVATLTGGNVVVVYSSFNQAASASMQDIYAQILSPAGQKVGAEFRVNQFTPFNQRTPAVAALADGGFVVTWVSEMQRSGPVDNTSPDHVYGLTNAPSIDIYARTFDANGAPAGRQANEVFINTASDPCANPTVAVLPSGGWLAAWSQKNLHDSSNSWDVVSAACAPDGSFGPTRLVNSYLYGDQFAPRTGVLGDNYFIAWTSLAQDGSWEGVYAQLAAADGSAVGPEFRVNGTTMGRQIHPVVGTDSSGRVLAVWSSMVGGINSFDLFAQQYVATGFVPVTSPTPVLYAAPIPDSAPNDGQGSTSTGGGGTGGNGGSTGSSGPNGPILDYPLPAGPAGTVLSNAFALAKGVYNGLFYDTNGVTIASAGYFTATTTEKRTYSGRISIGGKSYSFRGTLDFQGKTRQVVARNGGSPFIISLQLDLSGGDQLRGTITDGTWTSEILADRQVYTKSYNASEAGSYTMVIPADSASANSPQGNGFGTVTVDKLGNVAFGGSLADGTKVSQKSGLSKAGIWPLYASLYGGSGSMLSWVQIDSANNDLSGELLWLKGQTTFVKNYVGGFTNAVNLMGSAYHAPAKGSRVMGIGSQSSIVLSGGGLSESVTNGISLTTNNKVLAANPAAKLTLNITSSNGLFRGTVIDPQTGKPLAFQGVLFEQGQAGLGYFLNGSQSGKVYLNPQ
jgi:hypothetical protein